MGDLGRLGAGSDTSPADLTLPQAGFEDLLREVLTRVEGAVDEQTRWRLLLDAVVAMAADLSLDNLLSRIVEVASNLVGADYAALGVLSVGPGHRLRTFIHHGVTPTQVAEIGDLPTGHGLLGLIIDQPRPLRLHDIASHPASYGFPDNHPPMSSFLGVPVRIRDRVFGNLYLTEKQGGTDFTAQDEEIVVALAAAAGVAIENARLYQESARRERWLAATAQITGLIARSTSAHLALQAVADSAREVAEADIAFIVAGDHVDDLRLQVMSGIDVDVASLAHLPSTNPTISRKVVQSGEALVLDDLSSDEPTQAIQRSVPGWPSLGPAVFVPLRNADGVEGTLALAWRHDRADHFHETDAALPTSFAEQAALALQVTRSREARQKLVLLEDRDRIGRDLHDLVIQRLFAIGLGLESASRRLEGQPELASRLSSAVDDLDATVKDIRRSIFELRSSENSGDIQTEVTNMVDRAAATLKFRPSLQFNGPVRTVITADVAPHLLAVLGEALSNASRHARASTVSVELTVGDAVTLTVSDDGQGIPDHAQESGLHNMRERATRLGGTCWIDSPADGGTKITWSVPASAALHPSQV